MKRLAALIFIVLAAQAQEPVKMIRVTKAFYDRAKIEVELDELIRRDLDDAHLNIVDYKLRQKIRSKAIQLQSID